MKINNSNNELEKIYLIDIKNEINGDISKEEIKNIKEHYIKVKNSGNKELIINIENKMNKILNDMKISYEDNINNYNKTKDIKYLVY